MKTKSKLVILGIIVNQKREFLICQRNEPELSEVHLKWDLPGGTYKFGERLEETLEREVLEETGLTVKTSDFLSKTFYKSWKYDDHKQHTLILCAFCKLISGDLHLKDRKIKDLKWISQNELNSFEFLPTTKFFINQFIKPKSKK